MLSAFYRHLALACLAGCLVSCTAGAQEKRSTPSSAPQPPARSQPRGSPPPDAFAQGMIEAHNQARANARPPPKPPLPPLQWSAEAAKKAEAWAARCTFSHNPQRGDFGENLAAASPGVWKSPAAVVQNWSSEAEDYNLSRNSCAKGKACGHYTQLVWRDTTHVGCAKRTCTKNSPFGKEFPTWELWVCNYAPPGNVVGQKPY